MLAQDAFPPARRNSFGGLYPLRRLPRIPAVLVQPDGHFDLTRSLVTLDALEDQRKAGRLVGLIWDVRGRIDHPSASEIRTIVNRFDRWKRVAVLTGPNGQYAMAQMAALLSDGVAAVRTGAEALSWIGEAEH